MNNHKNNSGFTLIEIMVTIAIIGIFASIAIPSFSRIIESNRMSTATNELVANLLLTRSEALKRRNSVTLCPSSDQTNCNTNKDYSTGWIVFLDCGTIGQRDAGTIADCGPNDQEEVIKVGDGFDSVYMMNNVQEKITFNFTGRPAGVSTFSIGKDSSNLKKLVSVNLVGRVKSKDP